MAMGMGVRSSVLRLGAECVAVVVGLMGAGLCLLLLEAPPVRAPAIERYDVEFADAARGAGELPSAALIRCERGYSTVDSAVEVFDRPEDLACAGEPCTADAFLPLETAICFAEERFFGEGNARMAHFEFDARNGAPMWVLMSERGEIVAIPGR
ncbi:MAG: hypothetical protein R3A79_26015 [Nannocystaceae bacterium]